MEVDVVQEIVDDLSSNPVAFAVEDDWVLYHGTSESYSASIESFGLGHPEGLPAYWGDVQSFIAYWRILDLPSPAYVALASFSRDQDGTRAVSFCETFEHAARYAAQERGGETIALMRRAIGEIAEEIKNPDAIRTRLHEQRASLHELAVRVGFDSEESWDAVNGSSGSFHDIDQALRVLEDPGALLSALDKFKSYGDSGEHPPVVYAVRIQRSDISHLTTDSAGINYRGVLAAERLLARVRISTGRVIVQPGTWSEDALEAAEVWRKRMGHLRGKAPS